jgi:hypothetical protein
MESFRSKRRFVYVITLAIALVILIVNIIRYEHERFNPGWELETPIAEFMISIRFVKCIIDTYMFTLYTRIFLFFKKQKEQKGEPTLKMKVVAYTAFSIGCLNLYHSVSSITFYFLRYFLESTDSSQNEDSRYILMRKVQNYHRYMIYSVTDFLTAVTLIYLFYNLEKRLHSQPTGKKALMMRNNNGVTIELNDPRNLVNDAHNTEHLKNILRPLDETEDN